MSPGAEARRRSFIRLVAVIVSIAIVVLGVGLVRRGVAAAAYVNEAPPVAIAAPPVTAAAAAPAPPPPAATTGTLVRPAKKRVSLDGKPMRATSLTIACGAHSVKVGAAKAKSIDVPCGGTVTLK